MLTLILTSENDTIASNPYLCVITCRQRSGPPFMATYQLGLKLFSSLYYIV